jgi:stage II sporulation protein D
VPAGWPARWRKTLETARLRSFAIAQADADGRVLSVDTVWESPSGPVTLRVGGAQLRDWVGPARLKSTAFHASVSPASIRFEGRGNGHGVGLCQWGAKVMGERGRSMQAILKHYYPDARLVRAW